jgi:DNA mismatch repair protein MutS2
MQTELEEQKRLAEEKVISASRVQQEHERLLQQLKSRRKQMEREALREASQIVQGARKLVEKTISELRKEKASPRSIQTARQTLTKARHEIEAAIELPPQEEGRKPTADELKVGDEVYVVSLRSRGTLISLPDAKGMCQVRVKNARIKPPLSEIRLVSDSPKPRVSEGRGRRSLANVINLLSSKKSKISSSLDLRGDRAEDVLYKVDKYLDDAALAGLESVSIVHGKGTGALRDTVAGLLSEHPHVASFRLGKDGEGGSGVTVVELKE